MFKNCFTSNLVKSQLIGIGPVDMKPKQKQNESIELSELKQDVGKV